MKAGRYEEAGQVFRSLVSALADKGLIHGNWDQNIISMGNGMLADLARTSQSQDVSRPAGPIDSPLNLTLNGQQFQFRVRNDGTGNYSLHYRIGTQDRAINLGGTSLSQASAEAASLLRQGRLPGFERPVPQQQDSRLTLTLNEHTYRFTVRNDGTNQYSLRYELGGQLHVVQLDSVSSLSQASERVSFLLSNGQLPGISQSGPPFHDSPLSLTANGRVYGFTIRHDNDLGFSVRYTVGGKVHDIPLNATSLEQASQEAASRLNEGSLPGIGSPWPQVQDSRLTLTANGDTLNFTVRNDGTGNYSLRYVLLGQTHRVELNGSTLREASEDATQKLNAGQLPGIASSSHGSEPQAVGPLDDFTRRVGPLLSPDEQKSWEEYVRAHPDNAEEVARAGHDSSDADRAEAARALMRGAYGQDVVAWLRAGGLGSGQLPPGGTGSPPAVSAPGEDPDEQSSTQTDTQQLADALPLDQQQRYGRITDWPGFDPSQAPTEAQQAEFARTMYQQTRQVAAEILAAQNAGTEPPSIEQIWEVARQWRVEQGIAMGANSTLVDLLGQLRTSPVSTPLWVRIGTDKYAFIAPRTGELFPNPVPLSTVNSAAPTELANVSVFHGQIFGRTDAGVMVPLSTITYPDTGGANLLDWAATQAPGQAEAFLEALQRAGAMKIQHTSPQQFGAIQQQVSALYQQAIDPTLSDAAFIDTAARLYWWMAQSTIDSRGSAAKSDFVLRSVFQARGVNLPPTAPGVVPDLEAIFSTEADFVERFPMLFGGWLSPEDSR